MSLDLHGGRHVAARKHLDRRAHAGQAAGIDVVKGNFGLAFKGGQQGIEIDGLIAYLEEEVFEAVLGQTALQRHLTALKTGAYPTARTGILTFMTLAGGAAQTGTGTASHTAAGLAFFREGEKIVQLHIRTPLAVSQRQPRGAKPWQ